MIFLSLPGAVSYTHLQVTLGSIVFHHAGTLQDQEKIARLDSEFKTTYRLIMERPGMMEDVYKRQVRQCGTWDGPWRSGIRMWTLWQLSLIHI